MTVHFRWLILEDHHIYELLFCSVQKKWTTALQVFFQALAQLKKESMRLRSFLNWPLDFIRPQDLAKSGFIYTGRRDCVRCVFCG